MRVVIVATALVMAAFTFGTGVVRAEDAPVIPRPVDFLDWSRTVESIRSSDRTEAGRLMRFANELPSRLSSGASSSSMR